MFAWSRVLTVVLKSEKLKRTITFGTQEHQRELAITVDCYKYMSSMKDSATVKIDNLTYREIIEIINGEYFDVEVWAGYKTSSVNKIFSGGVLHVSNSLNADRTQTTVILCTSKMVAKYGQQRLGLSFNSGINMYSALKYVFKSAGVPNSNVSTQFKKKLLQQVETIDQTATSYVESLCASNGTFIVDTDAGDSNSIITLFDAAKSNKRVVKMNSHNILLTGGYPTMSSDGVDFNILPTMNLSCGTVVELDNSIIDISVTAQGSPEQMARAISANKAYWLDRDQLYMIFQMHYCLQNRGASFVCKINAKTRNLISNYLGG